MRIVSLLPSATEILFALGLDVEVVGVSYDCDFPSQVSERRVVVDSRIPPGLTSQEIDRHVREYVERGESLYIVNADALRELAADLVVTQDLCLVCAASPDDLAAVLAKFEKRPRVLSLNPRNLGDVWGDISRVARETSREDAAEKLLAEIKQRLQALKRQVERISRRPRVVFLEWLDPFYVGGHWVPEMIALAGGEDVFGRVGLPSFRVALKDIVAAAPDIIVIAPCGYDAEQARKEYCPMTFPSGWDALPAVRDGRVYAFEANAYASRPGPRLVTGVEALAKIFHPEIEVGDEAAGAFEVASPTRKNYSAPALDLSRRAHIL
ncbi:MAG TPA: cobalamin-binding protein [Candidatus Acidoferrum sp.]|jgi:iron complex transport system substrate-binding protein|nr:cobalamin-binding protein [Candidatus Acidoferrum sp.]